MPRLVGTALALSLALVIGPAQAQKHGRPSAAKENAEGDANGAIRALGAAGYNDHGARKPPPVTIPPLDMGRSAPSGPPHGTTGGALRRR